MTGDEAGAGTADPGVSGGDAGSGTPDHEPGSEPGGTPAPGGARRAWLAPRRSVLPALYALSAAWMLPVHFAGGTPVAGGSCYVLRACLDDALVALPLSFLFGLPLSYVAAGLLTGVVERRTRVPERFPAVFSPRDRVRTLAVALGLLALVVLLAGGYGALWTPPGAAALYTLHYPVFGWLAVLVGLGPLATAALEPLVGEPAGLFVAVVLVAGGYLLAVVTEVVWLYVLAYGLDRGMGTVRSVGGTPDYTERQK